MRLSPQERVIAWRLALGGDTSMPALIWHVWGDREPNDSEGCIRQALCSINAKLAPSAISIANQYGVRWYASDRAALLDILAAEIAANCNTRRFVHVPREAPQHVSP